MPSVPRSRTGADRRAAVAAAGVGAAESRRRIAKLVAVKLLNHDRGKLRRPAHDPRLARNGRDWHHLIELCGLVGALVVDADGIYNPAKPNDRLLLGLKGTMSEFELTTLRARLLEAARTLEVTCHVVRNLIRAGVLPARQVMPDAPWQIRAADLHRAEVRQALRSRARQGRPCRNSRDDWTLRIPGT